MVKVFTQGLIEDAIPAFLDITRGKCRFILKRLPESWKGAQVKIEEEVEPDITTLKSLGRNDIDHSNYELYLCSNPDQIHFCFESSKWALINRV